MVFVSESLCLMFLNALWYICLPWYLWLNFFYITYSEFPICVLVIKSPWVLYFNIDFFVIFSTNSTSYILRHTFNLPLYDRRSRLKIVLRAAGGNQLWALLYIFYTLTIFFTMEWCRSKGNQMLAVGIALQLFSFEIIVPNIFNPYNFSVFCWLGHRKMSFYYPSSCSREVELYVL